jgi:hypothetical protein
MVWRLGINIMHQLWIDVNCFFLISTRTALYRPGWLYFGFSLGLNFQLVPKINKNKNTRHILIAMRFGMFSLRVDFSVHGDFWGIIS